MALFHCCGPVPPEPGGKGIWEGPWLVSIVLLLQIKLFYNPLPEFADAHLGFEGLKQVMK